MRTIKIIYNPYCEDTRLAVDGIEHKDSKSRVDRFILGKPMENWVFARMESYLRWEGILPELMEELNDDELEIFFYGIPEHFEMLQSGLKKQLTLIEEKGYSSSAWTLQMKKRFLPEEIRELVLKFVQGKKLYAPDQHSLLIFENTEERLKSSQDLGINELKDIWEEICTALKAALEYCNYKQSERNMDVKIRFWKDAEKELEFAYEGGVKLK